VQAGLSLGRRPSRARFAGIAKLKTAETPKLNTHSKKRAFSATLLIKVVAEGVFAFVGTLPRSTKSTERRKWPMKNMRKVVYKVIKNDRETANLCAILVCATPIVLMLLILTKGINP